MNGASAPNIINEPTLLPIPTEPANDIFSNLGVSVEPQPQITTLSSSNSSERSKQPTIISQQNISSITSNENVTETSQNANSVNQYHALFTSGSSTSSTTSSDQSQQQQTFIISPMNSDNIQIISNKRNNPSQDEIPTKRQKMVGEVHIQVPSSLTSSLTSPSIVTATQINEIKKGTDNSQLSNNETSIFITENTNQNNNNNNMNIINVNGNSVNSNVSLEDEFEEEDGDDDDDDDVNGDVNNNGNNIIITDNLDKNNDLTVNNNSINNNTNRAVIEAERMRNANLQIERTNVNQVGSVSMPEQKYVEITDYLTLPQNNAAAKLGLPPSTFSKRWREAACGRKWPYRSVAKIDKEILTLLHNIPQGSSSSNLPEEMENTLSLLMKKRQEELKPVFIRI